LDHAHREGGDVAATGYAAGANAIAGTAAVAEGDVLAIGVQRVGRGALRQILVDTDGVLPGVGRDVEIAETSMFDPIYWWYWWYWW
jgi:hypothetical protein